MGDGIEGCCAKWVGKRKRIKFKEPEGLEPEGRSPGGSGGLSLFLFCQIDFHRCAVAHVARVNHRSTGLDPSSAPEKSFFPPPPPPLSFLRPARRESEKPLTSMPTQDRLIPTPMSSVYRRHCYHTLSPTGGGYV